MECDEANCGATTGRLRLKLALFSVPIDCPVCGATVRIAPFAQWLAYGLYFAILVASVGLAQVFSSHELYVFPISLLLGVAIVQALLWRLAPIEKSTSRIVLWRYRIQAIVAVVLAAYAAWRIYNVFIR